MFDDEQIQVTILRGRTMGVRAEQDNLVRGVACYDARHYGLNLSFGYHVKSRLIGGILLGGLGYLLDVGVGHGFLGLVEGAGNYIFLLFDVDFVVARGR